MIAQQLNAGSSFAALDETSEHEEKILSNGAKIQVINGRVVSFVLQKHSSVWHTQKNYTEKICCI